MANFWEAPSAGRLSNVATSWAGGPAQCKSERPDRRPSVRSGPVISSIVLHMTYPAMRNRAVGLMNDAVMLAAVANPLVISLLRRSSELPQSVVVVVGIVHIVVGQAFVLLFHPDKTAVEVVLDATYFTRTEGMRTSCYAGAPPLRGKCCPLTYFARSLTRYSIVSATSCKLAARRIGLKLARYSRTDSLIASVVRHLRLRSVVPN